jgi:hypothetical protein
MPAFDSAFNAFISLCAYWLVYGAIVAIAILASAELYDWLKSKPPRH